MNPRTIKLKQAEVPENYRFSPDSRDGYLYDLTPDLDLAVRVALVTGRPLLIRGEPGSGKSSFAPFMARCLDWRYYEHVVTARTEARDLMWRFDMVRRLGDAQAAGSGSGGIKDDAEYIEPGVLWWVFDRSGALKRGTENGSSVSQAVEPFEELNKKRSGEAVLLIDEIDKGDPDVPNNLLVALGSQQFTVEETGRKVERQSSKGTARSPLVIITTNQERALPQAFLRRCVIHELLPPEDSGEEKKRLIRIAASHFPMAKADLLEKLAERTMEARANTDRRFRKPSIAEYLDAVQACMQLEIKPGSGEWETIEKVTLRKRIG